MSSDDVPGAGQFLPDELDLEALREAAAGCRGCPLYRDARRVVFGEGPASARLMLVGESPGRDEDRRGRPFVGSAGSALDRALEEAGLEREALFITNVVKHVKWEERDGEGATPRAPYVREIEACAPWLEAEIDLVEPACLVALGRTAARGLLGEPVTISEARDSPRPSQFGPPAVVTYHPVAALRNPIPERRDEMRRALAEDLRVAAERAGLSG